MKEEVTAKTIKEEVIVQAIESVQVTLKRVIGALEDLKRYLREQN